MSPHLTSITSSDSPDDEPDQSRVEALENRVDALAQELLAARDAAVGAEAEAGVAKARVTELEHQVHVRDVEIDELRAAAVAARGPRAARVVGTGVSAGGRLARGVLRRVRSRI